MRNRGKESKIEILCGERERGTRICIHTDTDIDKRGRRREVERESETELSNMEKNEKDESR